MEKKLRRRIRSRSWRNLTHEEEDCIIMKCTVFDIIRWSCIIRYFIEKYFVIYLGIAFFCIVMHCTILYCFVVKGTVLNCVYLWFSGEYFKLTRKLLYSSFASLRFTHYTSVKYSVFWYNILYLRVL